MPHVRISSLAIVPTLRSSVVICPATALSILTRGAGTPT